MTLRPDSQREKITVGKLDRKITIQAKSVSQNEFGEEIETWATFASVYAAKADVSDSERMAAAEVSATITTRFRVRWSSALAAVNPGDHRVVLEGRVYDISGIKELGTREGLELTAAARAE